MARTLITPLAASPVGQALVYTAADLANGNNIAAGGKKTLISAKNTNAAPQTITIRANGQVFGGQTFPDLVTSVPATTGERTIVLDGPAMALYGQPNGDINIDYSNANFTVAAITLP